MVFRARPDAVELLPGLWLGSRPSPRQARELARLGITHVVDLRAEADADDGRWGEGVVVVRRGLVDHADPAADALDAAVTVVRRAVDAGETVYVHCHAGIERGPTVAVAALVVSGWPLSEAYRLVREKRPVAAPTAGQMAALMALADRYGAESPDLVPPTA